MTLELKKDGSMSFPELSTSTPNSNPYVQRNKFVL